MTEDHLGGSDFMDLIDVLFRQGLGELPVFYTRLRGFYLGNMVYEKGRIFFKDRGFLRRIDTPDEPPDWNRYLLGMVCYRTLLEWESLSFFGLDYCQLQDGIEQAHGDNLKRITTSEGERLYDFVGSIYRACHLMLDNELLPVVLLRPIHSKGSDTGLAIADLRALGLGAKKQGEIAEMIRDAITRKTTLNVDEGTTDEVD
jgi:hypothetical protein